MGDLKAIIFLLVFMFLATTVIALQQNTEVITDSNTSAGVTYETPDLSIFDLLRTVTDISTGNSIIDGFILFVFGSIVTALAYRGLRGQ